MFHDDVAKRRDLDLITPVVESSLDEALLMIARFAVVLDVPVGMILEDPRMLVR